MNYRNLKSDGEFVLAQIDNLRIPKDLHTPTVNGQRKTFNMELSRSPGWHYINEWNDLSMQFLPAYSESRGAKSPIKITTDIKSGLIVQTSIKAYNTSIPFGTFMAACFGHATYDTITSVIGMNHPNLTRNRLIVPKQSAVPSMILRKPDSVDHQNGLSRFRTLFTRQTFIENNKRLRELMSLKHFIGCIVNEDIPVYDGVITKGSWLTELAAFRIAHSGISKVNLMTETGISLAVPLLSDAYINLSRYGRELSEQQRRMICLAEEQGESLILESIDFPKAQLPHENTFLVYCLIVNRYLTFQLLGIKLDMNAYDNQVISTLNDKIAEFESQDSQVLDDKVATSRNLLEGVSSVTFDRDRIERAILDEESSLVIPINDENPYTEIASSGMSKIVKPSRNLPAGAILVRDNSQGIEDSTDSYENENIGKSTPITITTRLTGKVLETPLYVVDNCVKTEDIQMVEATKLPELCIVEYNCDLSEPYVLARDCGVTRYVPAQQVTHMRVSPFSSVSTSRATSVYLHHDDPKRSQMTAKAAEQSRSILCPERPLVETGIESLIVKEDNAFIAYRTVREIIMQYRNDNGLLDIPDMSLLESGDYELSVAEHADMRTKYKISLVQHAGIIGLFDLENKKTQKGSVSYVNIVPSPGKYYKIDDVVWQHNTVHNGSVVEDGCEALKYHTKGDLNFFDKGVGCGINAKVMFGFYHSFTVDDASIMNDRFVRSMGYDTPTVFVKDYFKYQGSEYDESFGFCDPKVKEKMAGKFDENGLPRPGTLVHGGFPIIYKYRTDTQTSLVEEDNLYLAHDETGEVIKVEDRGVSIRITMYNVVSVRIGDKFSGRHGNKTILAKIIPSEHMYYDYETGEPVDIVLNPLSLSSRMNIGQLPEMYVGAKQKESGASKIEPLYESVFEKYVKEHSDARDLTMRKMVDGLTGRVLPNEMFVGYMYLLRLVHISEDKVHAIGDSKEMDPAFMQPVGSGASNQRGQSVGAYETDLLVSRGCHNIINELNGLLSSDDKAYENMLAEIHLNGNDAEIKSPGRNLLQNHFVMATYGMYIMSEQKGNSFLQRFACDEVIKSYQPLHRHNIENDIVSSQLCRNPAYFELPFEVVTPVAVNNFNCGQPITLVGENDKFRQMTSNVIESLIKEEAFLTDIVLESLGVETYKVSKVNYPGSITGMSAVVEAFRKNDISVWLEVLEARLSNKETDVYDSDLIKYIGYARRVQETGGLQQFITTLMPVIPLAYRVSSTDSSFHHDITKGYIRIARATNPAMLYQAMKDFFTGGSSYGVKSMHDFLFEKDKNGRVRNYMLKRRVKNSMRANLCPAGYVHPDTLGLPLIQAAFIFQPWVNKAIIDSGRFKRMCSMAKSGEVCDDIRLSELIASVLTLPIDKARELINTPSLTRRDIRELKKIIKDACEGRYVFYSRAPALQETSLRGASVYVHDNDDTIRIHTLLTADQNADFDGDQEPVCAVFTEAAIEDIKTKLLPSSQLRRSNDGEVSLKINQDALLGLYFASIDEPDLTKQPVVISNLDELYDRVMSGMLGIGSTVVTTFKDKVYRGTAGRLLVSNVYDKLEGSKTDEDGYWLPSINKILNGKKDAEDRIAVPTLTRELSYKHSSVEATQIIADLQEFGYRVCNQVNMTLSLDDFAILTELPDPKADFVDALKSLGTWEDFGLLPEDWHHHMLTEIAKYKESLNIKQRLGKNNAFYKMIDSGAKGGEAQLNNMFGIIGFVNGNNGLLPTPILGSYVRGLSQFQAEDMSFEQRSNALSTVHGTQKPGEAFRTGSFELSGCTVVEKVTGTPHPHAIFYERDYNDTRYTLTDSTGGTIKQEISRHTFRGKPVTPSVIRQLSRNPRGVVKLDDGTLIKFKVTVDPDFMELAEKYMFAHDLKSVRLAVANQDIECDAKSFINYLEGPHGLAQDYAGISPLHNGYVPVGSVLGVKASTALSEPANQMVISKRNLVASTDSYSAVARYQDAVQYGNMFGKKGADNVRKGIAILAPENGLLTIKLERSGTVLILSGDSGAIYTWTLPVIEESALDFHSLDGDFVFEGQIVASPKEAVIDAFVHPQLSFTWDTVEYNGTRFKNVFLNPSSYLVQYGRFIYYRYLYDLYRGNATLQCIHFGCFALQQLRTVEILMENGNYTQRPNRFVDVSEVLDKSRDEMLYAFELTNGRYTILHTSGAISAYVYQDAMQSAYRAFLAGPIEDRGFTGKLTLGISLDKPISSRPLVYGIKESRRKNIAANAPVSRESKYEIGLRQKAASNPDDTEMPETPDLSKLFGEIGLEDTTHDEAPTSTKSEIDGLEGVSVFTKK